MIWQITWNPKRYDYKKVISDFKNGKHSGFIKNSKGMAKMKVVPTIDDEVYVSCDKLKIMKCKVVSNFVENEQEIQDEYHIGPTKSQPHTRNNIFLMLQIVEIYDNPEKMLGYQRTWVKLR